MVDADQTPHIKIMVDGLVKDIMGGVDTSYTIHPRRNPRKPVVRDNGVAHLPPVEV